LGCAGGSLGGFVGEAEEGEELGGGVVEDDFSGDVGEDILHGFEVEAFAGDFGGFFVFGELGDEAGGVAFGFVDALGGVAVGGGDFLFGLATGTGDGTVVFAIGLVDELLALLLGAVDFVEGGLDLGWRVDVAELDLVDFDADAELSDDLVEAFEAADFHVLTADGEDFVDGAVADDFAHDGFGEVAEGFGGFTEVEDVVAGVFDFVLDDPFDHGGVLVAGDHGFFEFLVFAVAGELVGVGAAFGAEAELEFLLAAGFDDDFLIDTEGEFEAEAGLGGVVVGAEAGDDGDAFRGDLVDRGEQAEDDEGDDQEGDQAAGAEVDLGERGQGGGTVVGHGGG
jgi:hypothetical protein